MTSWKVSRKVNQRVVQVTEAKEVSATWAKSGLSLNTRTHTVRVREREKNGRQERIRERSCYGRRQSNSPFFGHCRFLFSHLTRRRVQADLFKSSSALVVQSFIHRTMHDEYRETMSKILKGLSPQTHCWIPCCNGQTPELVAHDAYIFRRVKTPRQILFDFFGRMLFGGQVLTSRVFFLLHVGQTLSEVLTKRLGNFFTELTRFDSQEMTRHRCAPFCPNRPSSVAPSESVGWKTNIYFCSIARHTVVEGGILCWEMLHDITHTHTPSRFLPLFLLRSEMKLYKDLYDSFPFFAQQILFVRIVPIPGQAREPHTHRQCVVVV